jgi:hypothetical protein
MGSSQNADYADMYSIMVNKYNIADVERVTLRELTKAAIKLGMDPKEVKKVLAEKWAWALILTLWLSYVFPS